MQEETRKLAAIAALIYLMTNAVLFGAGLITVLMVPALNREAGLWIVVVVVASFVLALPAAWAIAPRLRSRHGRRRSAMG